MPVKKYKPTSAGKRFMTTIDFSELSNVEPEKSLIEVRKKHSGRNFNGHITVRHKGGGTRKMYRIIDFKRTKDAIPAKVATLEYDPNRTARIALLNYRDGEKRYILAPDGLQVVATVMAGAEADILVGNSLPLSAIPLGTMIHNIELKEGKGGQMARSAGTSAQLMAREGEWATLRLPSGEMRKVHTRCYATIGQVGNLEHENVSIGKAGRTRHLGKMPHNRGVSMNPVDHPLGGGEGKTSGGRHPVSPWGQPTKGYKTRRNKRTTKFIVKRRGKK